MFSRNEKYGQALHLQYGFDLQTSCRSSKQTPGWLSKLKSAFLPAGVNEQIANLNASIEMALDKSSIEQAVQMELRNTEAAANENQLEMFTGKIA